MLQSKIASARMNAKDEFPRKGLRIADAPLIDRDGSPVVYSNFRGHANLVILFAEHADPTWVDSVAKIADEKDAKVLLVVRSPKKWKKHGEHARILFDQTGEAYAAAGAVTTKGENASACYVTDRFGEVFAVFREIDGHPMPSAQDVAAWLDYIDEQCPECEPTEWSVEDLEKK